MPIKSPVDKLEFWKERIDRAKRVHIHYSVYLDNPNRWAKIAEAHKDITDRIVSGKVLDAGCGYGRLSQWFDDYTGVDFSPDFLELARQMNPGRTFIQADLKALPFKDDEFDWAICISIKQMVIDSLGEKVWDEMAKELKRVAKKVLILEYTEPEDYEIL
jgi:SAM-dependent methyltransferase